MDDDEEDEDGLDLSGILSWVLGVLLGLIITSVIIVLSLAATVAEKAPGVYLDFISTHLGAQGNNPAFVVAETWQVDTPQGSIHEVTSVLQPFYTTYWNGGQVLFYVPANVWQAAMTAYYRYPWCDPRFVTALAHSESPVYNPACSEAGACGVWQFMPGTWGSLWRITPVPDRSDLIASANAACRYTQNNGIIDALAGGNRDDFIREFARDAPVWNAHEGQAGYVWDLYWQIVNTGGNLQHAHAGPANYPATIWWKQPIIWLLRQAGLWPESLAYNPDITPGIVPAEGDNLLALPEQGTTITWGLHGQEYGDCALDVAGGNGTPVISPINGVVTQHYTDGYGNPVLQIENSVYLVRLLHGNWTPTTGDQLIIGQSVGSESNQGWTGWVDEYNTFHYCGTGSTCGYHVHFSVQRKNLPCVDPLTLINWPED